MTTTSRAVCLNRISMVGTIARNNLWRFYITALGSRIQITSRASPSARSWE
jgi:hypothetical protein